MNELACTFDEFRKRGKEFVDLLSEVRDLDELEQIWSVVAFSYLNIDGHTELQQHQAVLLLQVLGREKLKRELSLENQMWW